MAEVKHTPGPWKVENNGKITARKHLAKWTIAKVQANGPAAGVCLEQDIANARLIATAPELLEALKAAYSELRAILDSDGVPRAVDEKYFFRIVNEARAAIAKAEESDETATKNKEIQFRVMKEKYRRIAKAEKGEST